MSNGYHWNNDEIAVSEHLKDVQREADRVRPLRAAGVARTGGHAIVAFANALIRFGENLRRKYAQSHQVHQSPGGKYAA